MKKSNLLRTAAVLVSLSFVGVACGGSDKSVSDTPTTTVAKKIAFKCDKPIASIALQFAETGNDANLAAPMLKGAQLAVENFNGLNPDACVSLKTFDTQGDPAKTPAVAQAIVDDATIVGLVGPGFSDESKAALPTFTKPASQQLPDQQQTLNFKTEDSRYSTASSQTMLFKVHQLLITFSLH